MERRGGSIYDLCSIHKHPRPAGRTPAEGKCAAHLHSTAPLPSPAARSLPARAPCPCSRPPLRMSKASAAQCLGLLHVAACMRISMGRTSGNHRHIPTPMYPVPAPLSDSRQVVVRYLYGNRSESSRDSGVRAEPRGSQGWEGSGRATQAAARLSVVCCAIFRHANCGALCASVSD